MIIASSLPFQNSAPFRKWEIELKTVAIYHASIHIPEPQPPIIIDFDYFSFLISDTGIRPGIVTPKASLTLIIEILRALEALYHELKQ